MKTAPKARALAIVVVLAVIVGVGFALLKTRGQGPLRVTEVEGFTPEDPGVGSLVTWDHYVAWMGFSDLSSKGSRVLLYDLDSQKTKTLAQGLSGGGASWVRGSGRVVVYLSFAHLPCDDLPEDKRAAASCASQLRGWQMFSVDVHSGKQSEIAASKTEIDQRFPPLPELSWPYVVWTVPPAEQSSRPVSRGIAVYNLESRKGRVLLNGTITGRVTIEGKTLIFTAAVPGSDRWDLFAANVNGKGRLRRLTTSGKVIFPRSSNGMVAWQEPSAVNANQSPADLSPWARSVSGRDQPVRLAAKGSNPTPGDGFVAWIGPPAAGAQLLVKYLHGTQDPLVVEQQPNFAAGWWVWGNRLVWATIHQDGQKIVSVIHVANITRI